MRRDRVVNAAYAPGPVSRDIAPVAIGASAWIVFTFWLHGWLIGVRPLGNLLQALAPAL